MTNEEILYELAQLTKHYIEGNLPTEQYANSVAFLLMNNAEQRRSQATFTHNDNPILRA